MSCLFYWARALFYEKLTIDKYSNIQMSQIDDWIHNYGVCLAIKLPIKCKGLAMGAAPKAFRNEVKEWSDSGTADVATRTE
jgi:hypothetical protein